MLWGKQHHTLDMELFGPNSWLTSFCLAALKAAAEMAEAVGDKDFGGECAALAKKGAAYVDRRPFRRPLLRAGSSTAPIVRSSSLSTRAARPASCGILSMQAYWSEEYRQIKYQIGGGCLTDQIFGQWHADLAGLGDVLSPEHVVSALRSIYQENFRPKPQRSFQSVPRLRL